MKRLGVSRLHTINMFTCIIARKLYELCADTALTPAVKFGKAHYAPIVRTSREKNKSCVS